MTKKKVLLINAKREKCDSVSPHLGLAMLAAVLKRERHEVLVVDYQFKHRSPSPSVFARKFSPDVIGLSLYTATMKEAEKILFELSPFKIPIIVGGPHATLYADELVADPRISCIVKGEAEEVISRVVNNIKNNNFVSQNPVIEAKRPNPQDLPPPDFTAFFSYKDISIYPLLTSRGCPYHCTFCAVHIISSRRWRPRDPAGCVSEVKNATGLLPRLNSLVVYDDSPMTQREHASRFLDLYVESRIELPLTIINTRADCLDEDMVSLLKKARCPSIAIGVEHGHPDVFNNIGKGETLDDIKKAAMLIKKLQIPLCLCFIIGLPGDSLEKTRFSIDLAKELKPDHIYWNMVTPFRGTKLREWYDQNGKVFDVVNHSSWVDADFMCDEPCAETADFDIEDLKKAYLMAILETVDTRLKIWHIPRLIPYVRKYSLYGEFLYWIPKHIYTRSRAILALSIRAFTIFRSNGIKELYKRTVTHFVK